MGSHEKVECDGDAAVTKNYKVCGRVVMRKIGEETLLVPISGPASGGRVYPINETARIIWDGLSEGFDVGQIATRLVGIYDVPAEQAHADCMACAEAMVGEALLEEVT
jgi:hypothetical protein